MSLLSKKNFNLSQLYLGKLCSVYLLLFITCYSEHCIQIPKDSINIRRNFFIPCIQSCSFKHEGHCNFFGSYISGICCPKGEYILNWKKNFLFGIKSRCQAWYKNWVLSMKWVCQYWRYIRYQKIFWKLVKILLSLIIFYKMNTDNDVLLKFWFHFMV